MPHITHQWKQNNLFKYSTYGNLVARLQHSIFKNLDSESIENISERELSKKLEILSKVRLEVLSDNTKRNTLLKSTFQSQGFLSKGASKKSNRPETTRNFAVQATGIWQEYVADNFHLFLFHFMLWHKGNKLKIQLIDDGSVRWWRSLVLTFWISLWWTSLLSP